MGQREPDDLGNPFWDRINRHTDKQHPFIVDLTSGRELLFPQMASLSRRFGSWLQAQGLTAGKRVGIMMPNSLEFVVIWYAAQLAGATVVPISTELFADGAEYIVEKSEIAALFADEGFELPIIPRIPVYRVGVSGEPEERLSFGLDAEELEPVSMTRDHLCQISFSSGTTGRPKGVLRRVEREAGCVVVADRIGIREDDVLYVYTPLVHGLTQLLVHIGLDRGLKVVLRGHFSATAMWDDAREHGVTVMSHIGAIIAFLLRRPPSEMDRRHSVRASFGLGAGYPAAAEFEERFGVHLIEYYGMTETSVVLFNNPPGRVGSVGKRGSTGAQIELRDQDDNVVPDGVPGEAWVRPDAGVPLPEYLGDEEAMLESRQDGWFRTGDVLRVEDGYFYFVGRQKDSLRRRGKNITPEDIERIADRSELVVLTAAVAVPSDYGDDEIKLCVQWQPGVETDAALPELWSFLCEGLPKFMRPDYIQVLAELPLTPTGKLKRFELRSNSSPIYPTAAPRREGSPAKRDQAASR